MVNQPSYVQSTYLKHPLKVKSFITVKTSSKKAITSLTIEKTRNGLPVLQPFENLNVLENTIVAQTTVLKRDRSEAEKVAKEQTIVILIL